MELVNPLQLNEYVRPLLHSYLAGNYTLTVEGQDLVIGANAKLDEAYAIANDLPIAQWCYRDIKSRIEILPPAEFGTVMDVCAGTGFVSLNIMKNKLFKKCIALDINPSALEILKKTAMRLGVENIEPRVGNIFATEFSANSFDCIVGNAFLHHLPDNAKFLKEMFRILKPGGTLCLTGEPSVSSMKWENYFQRKLLGLVGRRQHPKGQIPLTDIWQFDCQSLTTLLTGSGFKEISILGFGKWSAAIHTLLSRLWVRFSGRPAPAWVGYLTNLFRRSQPARGEASDAMAALVICARKGPQ